MLLNKLHIDPTIFRAYDIRGVVNQSLTQSSIYAIGRAIGTYARTKHIKQLAVGRDGRLSGPMLSEALCNGIISTGCDVVNLDVVPTPILYYATQVFKTGSGVMLTGSHNPPEYNGLKIMVAGETLAEKAIQVLYQSIINHDFIEEEKGRILHKNLIDQYLLDVVRDIKLNRPLKIVVDCGSGVAGAIAPALYRRLGCEVIELFCDVDGRFPHHHPDPSQAENLQDLIKAVKENQADIGLAFDGDGDRLGVVTNAGEIIWPDRLMMLFAKAVLEKQPGAKIIYDVKCTNHLEKIIKDAGGEPIIWRTGHSLIKSKLKETQAALAGEMSGHIFFKDRWNGFDDAIYAGARLLEILSQQMLTSEALFQTIPNSINTPELKIYVDEEEKFKLMANLIANANFEAAELITIDGLRVNFADGWGLVRPSNTTPCLVLRFEAETSHVLERIKTIFRNSLLAIKPDLVIPF